MADIDPVAEAKRLIDAHGADLGGLIAALHERARSCVFLHSALTRAHSGEMGLAESIALAALNLSVSYEHQTARLIEHVSRHPSEAMQMILGASGSVARAEQEG